MARKKRPGKLGERRAERREARKEIIRIALEVHAEGDGEQELEAKIERVLTSKAKGPKLLLLLKILIQILPYLVDLFEEA